MRWDSSTDVEPEEIPVLVRVDVIPVVDDNGTWEPFSTTVHVVTSTQTSPPLGSRV
jgi:hypothetical protein